MSARQSRPDPAAGGAWSTAGAAAIAARPGAASIVRASAGPPIANVWGAARISPNEARCFSATTIST